MTTRSVFIAREDHDRFFDLLERSAASLRLSDAHVRDLLADAAHARPLPAAEIPRTVVTLYSWVRLRMADIGHEITCQIVMPAEADRRNSRISVLSPLGATIMGRRVGESVTVHDNAGPRDVALLGVYQARRPPTPGAPSWRTSGSAPQNHP
jgi:regulator of nucleoside diphosphate kinase